MIDHDDTNLSVREVNDILAAHDLNPIEIRSFAWDLVQQEIEEDLPKAFVPRVIELGKRLRKILATLEEHGVSREAIKQVILGIHEELTKNQHKAKLAAYAEKQREQEEKPQEYPRETPLVPDGFVDLLNAIHEPDSEDE